MNTKLMPFIVASVCAVSLTAFAEEAEIENSEVEEASESSYSFGADVEFFSADVWRNAVCNDRMVIEPCVWGEWSFLSPFSLGGSIWQNYDLTSRRRAGYYKHALTETDYNVHLGVELGGEDVELPEAVQVNLEFGHDWFTYQGVRRADKAGNPDTHELYLKASIDNPIVTVYGQTSWMYHDFGEYQSGFHYELGLNKEVEVTETLTLGADWNVGMADRDYQEYLYGLAHAGLTGTTIKLYSILALTDWVSLQATIAYTGLLNADIRSEINEDLEPEDTKYSRDLLWGGVSLKFEF